MSGFRNVFACLVHENQECVIDLVRNLRYQDPASVVLLYNGGADERLLNHGFPFEEYGAVVHPNPQPLAWGRLHDFALDCMRFALDHWQFDALTIVDSDQVGARREYSNYLAPFFAAHPQVGLAGNSAVVQPRTTRVGPVIAAFKEIELWRPFLARFEGGADKFGHWSFWPSTIFSAAAARDLTRLFATDHQLQDIMARSQIWATEEVVFPLLVALLGYQVAENPCSYEFVKHRVAYSTREMDRALTRPPVYWIHPVNRRYDDPLRTHLRQRFNHYEAPVRRGGSMPAEPIDPTLARPLFLTMPILNRMRAIEGWLEDDEADLLIAATTRVIQELPRPHVIVEVGSYCGRSTVVFGSALKSLGSDGRVYAIDPHDGVVGALDKGLRAGPSTLARFAHNIADAGLEEVVVTVQQRSFEVNWEQPISLLFIDGLHDYANVARDFFHFELNVAPGGYIAFHDYADYYPGVKAFVNELIGGADYERVLCVRSMMLLRRRSGSRSDEERGQRDLAGVAADDEGDGDHAGPPRIDVRGGPLVSCIMPTADRRGLAARAVEYFLRQDYPTRELIVVDDGSEPVSPALRPDPRIRCVRLERKTTLGAKRNLACELAHGEVIAHWDDDDWEGQRRLTAQIEDLRRSRADIVGLDRLLVYDPLHARAWMRGGAAGDPPALAGGTLCYRKEVWRARPFLAAPAAEDDAFLQDRTRFAGEQPPGAPFYVALMHPSNARPSDASAPSWQPHPVEAVRSVFGRDCAYYDVVFPSDAQPALSRADGSTAAVGVSDRPLVSCLMPTFNRRMFVPQALRCFLKQDYPHKELIVIDDGDDQVGHEVSADGSIHYVSLDRRLSLGEKRNLAAALSSGEILAHWDDDDWYGPRYLTRIADRLCQAGQDSLAGLSRYLVYLLASGSLRICSSKGPAGATFSYWKAIWQRHPYRDAYRAEDYFFLEDARPRVRCLQDAELFAIVRHRDHTWTHEHGRDVTRRLSLLPRYKKSIEAVVGSEAAAFYDRARQTLLAAAETLDTADASTGF